MAAIPPTDPRPGSDHRPRGGGNRAVTALTLAILAAVIVAVLIVLL